MPRDGKTYVLMVTAQKTMHPILAPATPQGAIEAVCSFEVFPAAVSDDVEALRERARKMREEFPTIEGWSTVEVSLIGGIDRDALLALADEMESLCGPWSDCGKHYAPLVREALGVSE